MFERFLNPRPGKEFAFGSHCWSADPTLYEVCGRLGYDRSEEHTSELQSRI